MVKLTVSQIVDIILKFRKELELFECSSHYVSADLAIGVDYFDGTYNLYYLDVETGCPEDTVGCYDSFEEVESTIVDMFL